MEWLGVTAVGFLLVLALVIWLARGSTARWEREKRAARAPRPDAGAPPPAGAVARLRGAVVRAAGAVPRLPGSAPERLRHVVGVLTPLRRLLPDVPPLRRVLRPLRIRRAERTPVGSPGPTADERPVDEDEHGGEAPVHRRTLRRRWSRPGPGALRRRRPLWSPHRVRRDERAEDRLRPG